MNIRTRVSGHLFPKIYGPPLRFLVSSLGWEFEKMMSFSHKYHRMGWKYQNNWCRKLPEYKGQCFFIPHANCCTCHPVWYFWENDVIYSNFQPRLGTRKINGGSRFSERKFQKHAFYNVRNRSKFGKISMKNRMCMKIYINKQMDIENLIIVAI